MKSVAWTWFGSGKKISLIWLEGLKSPGGHGGLLLDFSAALSLEVQVEVLCSSCPADLRRRSRRGGNWKELEYCPS